MSPEEREELASLYVLGALEGEELAAFERELTAHPELAALVARIGEASTILATSVPQHKAPEVGPAIRLPTHQSQVPDDEPPRQPAFSFGWVPWAIAAGLAVCCALLWNERSRLGCGHGQRKTGEQNLQGRVASLDAERGRLESRDQYLGKRTTRTFRSGSPHSSSAIPQRKFSRSRWLAQPGAPPAAEVVGFGIRIDRGGAFMLPGLPKPAPDKDYQLWIITPESKQPVDAGIVPARTKMACLSLPRGRSIGCGPRDFHRTQRGLDGPTRTRRLS